jgi:hypothetical protein
MSKAAVEPIEEVESKLDKVKGVVKRNWKPFAIGVGTVSIIVVTCYVTRGRRIVIVSKVGPWDLAVQNMNSFFGPWFSKQNLTVVHNNGTRGHPGFMTYWVEGNQVFPSQKMASLATGAPESQISEVIRGVRDTARGQTFISCNP